MGLHEPRVLLDRLQEQPPRLEVVLLGVPREELASLQHELVGLGVLGAVPAEAALLLARERQAKAAGDARRDAGPARGAGPRTAGRTSRPRDGRPSEVSTSSAEIESWSPRRETLPVRTAPTPSFRPASCGSAVPLKRKTVARAMTRSDRRRDICSIRLSVSPSPRYSRPGPGPRSRTGGRPATRWRPARRRSDSQPARRRGRAPSGTAATEQRGAGRRRAGGRRSAPRRCPTPWASRPRRSDPVARASSAAASSRVEAKRSSGRLARQVAIRCSSRGRDTGAQRRERSGLVADDRGQGLDRRSGGRRPGGRSASRRRSGRRRTGRNGSPPAGPGLLGGHVADRSQDRPLARGLARRRGQGVGL